MPGVTKYNLVDDAHDLRIPMHNDEVFKHGVCFEAKVGVISRLQPGVATASARPRALTRRSHCA